MIMKNTKNMKKTFILAATLIAFCGLSTIISCSKKETIESLKEVKQFDIPYGNFEEQISVGDLNSVGTVRKGIAMRDGFFYVIDGESEKIMELISYGDLLSLYYYEDSQTADLINKSERVPECSHKTIGLQFDYPGQIAVDSNKTIYVTGTFIKKQQEVGPDGLLYSQGVLKFDRDGTNMDYIGQQGPGGKPFPLIKNIYITQSDELVVVSNSNDGFIVYWIGKNGFPKYTVNINSSNIPKFKNPDIKNEIYATISNVIPSQTDYKLYVYVDYYSTFVDDDSMVQSGVNYLQSLLYPLDCIKETYDDSVSIPPYEESVVVDYSKLTYRIPYDFMGVTANGWKYFIIKNQDGFNIEMIQNESQKILRRHLDVNQQNNLYYDMHLSPEGIITALYLDKDTARVVWYRTDSLIDAILNN